MRTQNENGIVCGRHSNVKQHRDYNEVPEAIL